ncbi:LuxR family transcriptional regulator [Rubrivivax sp. A210]|uniref:LuxR C-terminal-related transcriptional regulator n=1 Tax=Rubrivivax sp. A210 TaxID=2772301 RepID=UPI0019B0D958|nr:LuxR C-terminal-related transcriptional regulator [Rubrivivax sp. A210]CAD5366815.1 LuxR family transcriptional regulator [Rubrivivax sp. A210]
MEPVAIRHQDYLDVGTSPDRDTFERRLIGFAQKMEFGIVSAAIAVDRPGERPIFVMIGNTPASFLEASQRPEDARRDPVMKRMRTSSVPFIYDQRLYVDDGAGDLWEAQAPHGYRTGVSMALHLPAGRHFCLGVDREAPLPSTDVALTRMMADLQLLAVFAQETAIRVLLPTSERESEAATLTPRERQVLQWTRDGKTAWEVGAILGMSENTVNFHLKNATSKLGVTSKHQAVLKAMNLGLI